MKAYRKRLQKKYLKIVARYLEGGKEIPQFYLNKAVYIMQFFWEHQYISTFRPWWYEQMDSNPKLDFLTEHKRHFEETERKFIEWSGIDPNVLVEILKTRKKEPRNRKPRKYEGPLIRKLKNPKEFEISLVGRQLSKKVVLGEKAFTYQGRDFFVYHNDWEWVVSDVETGLRVSGHERYKRAIQDARIRIEKNFDSYLKACKEFEVREDTTNE